MDLKRLLFNGIGLLSAAVVVLSPGPLHAAPAPANVKELNLVFLHGMGGTTCSLQLLTDYVTKRLSAYKFIYEQSHPGTTIQVNMLSRCYPGYADIRTWAANIADSIDKNFAGKDNLIIVGHSMGGKTALYSVAHNVGGLGDKVAAVVTVNSPVKNLSAYYAPGGAPVLNYCRTGLLGSDQGVCNSVTYYDASKDGTWVAQNRHWLAFISAENAPISPQFDRSGVDAWPHDMDDGIVPISAMYSDGADVVYYGEQAHSSLSSSPAVADFLADQILRYIFGMTIECSSLAESGSFRRAADWLLGKDRWVDVVGEITASQGTIVHRNNTLTTWQDWQDVVGMLPPGGVRTGSSVLQFSLPGLSSVQEAKWQAPDDPTDGRIYLRTRAAPLSTIRVQWRVYRAPLLSAGATRAYYEIAITDGTPLVGITHVSWTNPDLRDLRLTVNSEADSPFRWFNAKWRVYQTETRQHDIIDEIPVLALVAGS